MSAGQWGGLVLALGGIGIWFLVPRVVREHEPSNPRAQRRRPRIAGVWSEGRRTSYLWTKRAAAVLFVVVGLLLLTGVLGNG